MNSIAILNICVDYGFIMVGITKSEDLNLFEKVNLSKKKWIIIKCFKIRSCFVKSL